MTATSRNRALCTAPGIWTNMLTGAEIPFTPPEAQGIGYGVNVQPGSSFQGIAQRNAWFGSVPISRVFYTGDLGTFGDRSENTSCSTKRSQVSFKPSNSFANIASGGYDTRLAAYAASVPSDWKIYLTMHHEPNGELSGGQFTISDYKAAWLHLSAYLYSLPSKDRVVPSIIFSAPKPRSSPAWNNNWMWDFDEMNNPHAQWCWDSYGGKTGTQLGTYPPVEDCIDMGYDLLDQHGWLFEYGHWGITEFFVKRRDADTDGSVQGQWHKDYAHYCANLPVPARHVLLFGGNAGDEFDTVNMQNAWREITLESNTHD